MNIAVNGPTEIMYKVKPLYDTYRDIELPGCMYETENIYKTQAAMVDDAEKGIKLDELESSQMKLLQKLEDMKSEVLAMKKELNATEQLFEKPPKFQDIVISASPERPPLSIWVFYQLLAQKIVAHLATYVHSSLVTVPEIVTQLKGFSPKKYSDVSLSVIWKDGVGKDAVMVVDPIAQGTIEGEVNIVRYIARLLNLEYEKDVIVATQMDTWLEMAHTSLSHGNDTEHQSVLRSMNSHLGKNSFLVGNTLSIADIVLWSLITQTRLHENLPSNVDKWWKNLNSMDIFQFPASIVS